MARHDLLTGLANRTNFMEKLEEAGARLRRRHETFTVFMLDLDRFKNVNDSLGHPAGDALLKETADRLKKALRETDLVARLGGDEFAIIQAGDADQRGAASSSRSAIIALISAPYELHGNNGEHRHQHRHRDGPRAERRFRHADEAGRSRALPDQIRGPQRLLLLRRTDDRRRRRAAAARSRSARRHRGRPDRNPLSADPPRQDAQAVRAGGAGALAPPGEGVRTAVRVHPSRRGDRPHRSARRMGPPQGLRDGEALAASE